MWRDACGKDLMLCSCAIMTVTGAPKTWAIQIVEDMERSPRCWYIGAVGLTGFEGTTRTRVSF